MTEEKARKILENYKKVNEVTGEIYFDGLIVVEHLGKNKFLCKRKGVEYKSVLDMPEFYVRDDGNVLLLPK